MSIEKRRELSIPYAASVSEMRNQRNEPFRKSKAILIGGRCFVMLTDTEVTYVRDKQMENGGFISNPR